MKVLVTGGTGFVGKRLQEIKPDWIYVSSRQYDLLKQSDCERMFEDINPSAVVHLAGKVGGIKINSENQVDFFTKNCLINLNVVSAAYNAGVERLLASISTCAFPNEIENYPFDERDILKGPPAKTNFSYGYAKRMLYVLINSYRDQYGVNYSTFSPSNIYGPGDNFDLDTSHFVPALIKKFYEAKDGDTVEFWGTGRPLRQQLYVDDLAVIIPELLEKHNTNSPLIVAADENLSIREMIDIYRRISHKDVKITFNNVLDGQYRKDGNNVRLLELLGDFEFTSFKEGVYKTYNWYIKNGALNE